MSTKLALRKDKRYKRYQKILENVQASLNLETDKSEACNLHATRPIRVLVGKNQYSYKKVLTAVTTDLSVRARLVEIRQQNSMRLSLVVSASENIKAHIRTNHADLMRGLSNEASRNAMLDEVTSDAVKLAKDIGGVVELIDYFIKDIDQSSHSMRHIVDVLKLLDSSKKIV